MSRFPAESPNASADLQSQIRQLGPWFHNLHLPDGSQTFPDHWLGDFPSYKWQALANHIPHDLHGWNCLDIGCNAGFYCFELARRGAAVLGIDNDERYLRQARWACDQFHLADRVQFQSMQVYDLARLQQKFDLVLFLGVFYHLRYPMLGLDIVTQKVRRLLAFQTLMTPGHQVCDQTRNCQWQDRQRWTEPGWPKMAFLEHGYAGDPTNWWAPNHAAVLAMLRSSGMRVLALPDAEVYLCEPDPLHPSPAETWNANEFRSATGQSP